MSKDKDKDKELLNKLMAHFDKHNGGTDVDPDFTSKDPEALKIELQNSFDSIFPELMKPSKHRKHVIFDDDVYQTYESLAGNSGSKFSSIINTALRRFMQEKISISKDPVEELLIIRKREIELIDQIKKLDLNKELINKIKIS